MMGCMSMLLMMKEFPSKSEFKDQAIGSTSILDDWEVLSVRSIINDLVMVKCYLFV